MATPNTYAVHVSTETHKIEAWLASDEALARQLQEEENSHDATATREFAGNVSLEPLSPAVEYRPANNAAQVSREDNVDPDNMSYEQLQALGDAVGTQSRGLSDDLISYLVPFKNKCYLFSRKKNNEECVICKSTYKSRQKLIRLPCSHCYHADCITRWLKINKEDCLMFPSAPLFKFRHAQFAMRRYLGEWRCLWRRCVLVATLCFQTMLPSCGQLCYTSLVSLR